MRIRTLVFDFGNVVAFFSHERAARQLAAFARREVTSEEILRFLFFTDLEPRFETGQLSAAEVLAMLRREFDLGGSDEELTRAFADIFTPNEHVCGLVPELRGRYRLALLSNTNDLHYRLFRRQFAATLDLFDYLFVSHEVGLRKPDPGLFEYVAKRIGCAAAECLFIDDLPANVEAARRCGWQGLVYARGDDLRQQLSQLGVSVAA